MPVKRRRGNYITAGAKLNYGDLVVVIGGKAYPAASFNIGIDIAKGPDFTAQYTFNGTL